MANDIKVAAIAPDTSKPGYILQNFFELIHLGWVGHCTANNEKD